MKARITVFSVNVDCPKCKEPLEQPDSGSLVWEASEVRGEHVRCPVCNVVVTVVLPKWAR